LKSLAREGERLLRPAGSLPLFCVFDVMGRTIRDRCDRNHRCVTTTGSKKGKI
jgi:hypothetical protein